MHEAALTHLWVSSPAGEQGSGRTLLHGPGAAQLAPVLPLLEEVDLSGQPEIGGEGWAGICDELRMATEADQQKMGEKASSRDNLSSSSNLKLRLLKVGGCRLKEETVKRLEEFSSKSELKVDFGQEKEERRKRCFCC